jgi:glycosyltransferase 2 family protein
VALGWPQEGRVLRSWRFWAGVAISVAFIVLAFHSTNLSAVGSALEKADYRWLAPALVIYVASLYVRAIRYRALVRRLTEATVNQMFAVLCIGFMANNIVPARAGELVRAYVMGERYGVKKVAALGTILVERLFDGLTLLSFLLVTVLLLGANSTLKGLAAVALVVFVFGLLIFGAILAWPERCWLLIQRMTDYLPQRARPLARDLASSLLDGMITLRQPGTALVVLLCSPIAWAMEGCTFWCVGQAFGIHLHLGWFIMTMAAGNLALTVPSSQGGIGPFEYFAKQVLLFAGIGGGVAAAFTIAVHAMVILPVVALGLVFLSLFGVSLSRAIATESDEDGEPPAGGGGADADERIVMLPRRVAGGGR